MKPSELLKTFYEIVEDYLQDVPHFSFELDSDEENMCVSITDVDFDSTEMLYEKFDLMYNNNFLFSLIVDDTSSDDIDTVYTIIMSVPAFKGYMRGLYLKELIS